MKAHIEFLQTILLTTIFIFTSTILLAVPPEQARLDYALEIGDKHIGELIVTKTQTDSSLEFDVTSHAEFNLLGKKIIDYELHCVFKDGIMTSSVYRSYKNGKLYEQTLTSWKGDHYEVDKDGKISMIDHPIKHSSIELYFDEPVTGAEFYSEKNGSLISVSRLDESLFMVAKAGKKKGSEYQYQDDQLKKIEIDYVVASFSVVNK